MSIRADMSGMVFSRLTVTRFLGGKGHGARWECVCTCGSVTSSTRNILMSSKKKSCGCLKREVDAVRPVKHGHSATRAHKCWRAMHSRCSDPRNASFVHYGARGIAVCERWASFDNFLADMGAPPPRMSIERIDVNGGYSLANCRWATSGEQSRNKRTSVILTVDGRTQCASDWCAELGLSKSMVCRRIRAGWAPADALQLPRNRRAA